MATTTVHTDLSPQFLIQQHYVEAQEELKRLQSIEASQKSATSVVRSSGGQGSVEPFTIVNDKSAWYTKDVKQSNYWIYELSSEDILEIDAALEKVAALKVRKEEQQQAWSNGEKFSGCFRIFSMQGNLLHIQEKIPTKEQFHLPSLGPQLEALRDEVVRGRGFQLIRGLPVEKYTREEVVTIYWGFGLYWGNVVSQNAKGHIVGHVKNIGHDVKRPITRVYATPLPQPWHNDSADVVGLLCLKQAEEGGQSSWASSISVHNEMLRLGRRDLVEELAKPQWWVDRKGEVPPGKTDVFQLQVFHYHQGFLSVNYADTYYQLAQRHEAVPRLSEKQKEALRVFNALASSDALRMDYFLQPGDIQLLNNLTQQHQRSSFKDFENVDERRHLLRLWVSPPENRPLPEEYAELWNNTLPGQRGGISVQQQLLTVPLEAE